MADNLAFEDKVRIGFNQSLSQEWMGFLGWQGTAGNGQKVPAGFWGNGHRLNLFKRPRLSSV
jgi:hypothetical protein